MQIFIFVLIIVVCVLLALIVLIQNPKGGGLDSSFQSANQIGGVKRTADFLEKSTWSLAIGLFVLCLVSAGIQQQGVGTSTTAPMYQETVPMQPGQFQQDAGTTPMPAEEEVQFEQEEE